MNESEVQKRVWAGDAVMEIMNICMAFQARRLDEITQGVKDSPRRGLKVEPGLLSGMLRNQQMELRKDGG